MVQYMYVDIWTRSKKSDPLGPIKASLWISEVFNDKNDNEM